MSNTNQSPPDPRKDWAYFLDFDGTLVDIAEMPKGVCVKQELVSLLVDLDQVTGGTVVLVSGRPIADLDSLLKPLKLRASGLHGLEYRVTRNGQIERRGPSPVVLDPVRPSLASFARSRKGVLIEDKGISLAIHFRRAPECGAEARQAAESACSALGPAFVCLAGKMVYEIKPREAHKGQVIERFLNISSFHNRIPVFVGDDITDEDGFLACNDRGGISIRVGAPEEPTVARFRLRDVEGVQNWLGQILKVAQEPDP